ncbi:hypothetical protein Y1Q_0009743 [Alligator mississippiensis]|uniref:Uncharacterized protein n=1 Tax=Alligator mississippiensis TaxID=8496 RepID=A0A151MWL9_ALLMI|nr:hypothetical protein Y1Q_0009743 [Alligator mississippiensis]
MLEEASGRLGASSIFIKVFGGTCKTPFYTNGTENPGAFEYSGGQTSAIHQTDKTSQTLEKLRDYSVRKCYYNNTHLPKTTSKKNTTPQIGLNAGRLCTLYGRCLLVILASVLS